MKLRKIFYILIPLLILINVFLFYKNNFTQKQDSPTTESKDSHAVNTIPPADIDTFNTAKTDTLYVDSFVIDTQLVETLPMNANPENAKTQFIAKLLKNGFVEVNDNDFVKIQMVYATSDNFLHQNVYQDFNQCFMQKVCYDKFLRAQEILKNNYPQYKFLIYDAYRPFFIQKKMWSIVSGTPQETYVASPRLGSLHNFGLAIDLTLADRSDAIVDMGTGYDDFTKLAQPRYEDLFVSKGQLTTTQVNNRKILREVMTQAGFQIINNEWWHFQAMSKEQAIKKYKVF